MKKKMKREEESKERLRTCVNTHEGRIRVVSAQVMHSQLTRAN